MTLRVNRMLRIGIWAALGISAATATVEAKTFRWANDGDANSMDPYARQETFLLLFDQSMYEPLLRWDRQMKPEVQRHIEYASGYLDLKMLEEALREAEAALALEPEQPQAIAMKSAISFSDTSPVLPPMTRLRSRSGCHAA